jgi:hypothetical protein
LFRENKKPLVKYYPPPSEPNHSFGWLFALIYLNSNIFKIMQKNLLLAICWLLSAFTATAQQATYQMEVDEQPYVEITEDTLVFNTAWFNVQKKVPLGFEFHYFDRSFDSVTVWNDGLYFDYESSTEDSTFYFMLAFEAFLSDRSIPGPWITPQSPITYKTEGLPGSRIFKFQVKNAGFSEGGADDYTNFQTWLYEEDQSFEYRYGDTYAPSNAWQDGFDGPLVAVVQSFEEELLVVEGDESVPELVSIDATDPNAEIVGLASAPIEGRVYRFKLANVPIISVPEHEPIAAFPNPVGEIVTLSVPDTYLGMPYRIVSVDGREMTSGQLTSKTLNTTSWLSGNYIIEIATPAGKASGKLIKK